jgi:hypothetical protein
MHAGGFYDVWVSIGGISGDQDVLYLFDEIELDLVDASGLAQEVDYFEPIDEEYDPASGRYNLLLWMSLPDNLVVGPHELRVRFTDPVAGEAAESSLPINIVGR